MQVNREILRLALPSILANITIPLVGLVDTAIVGHISDASAIGGIAVGTMLFDLLYWNFGFLRVGTSGMTAQAYGRGNREECARLLCQSTGMALAGALAIWLLQWVFVTLVLACVPCSDEVATFARRYFFVRVWAAPATLSLMALKGWFIGMQDTVTPMVTDIVVNVVNIVASYLLAVHSPLGALGVAHGTVIAQYTGLCVAIGVIALKYKKIWSGLSLRTLLRDRSDLGRLLRLNGNLFVRSLCFMVVYVGFTSLASKYGDTELAVSSIMMKLFMLFSYFVDGFAYAGEALVGRFIGDEEKHSEVNDVVKTLFIWSLGVGVVFTLLFAWLAQPMYRLMTSDMDILTAIEDYTPWLVAMPIVSSLAFMWDGVYTGATAGREIRNGMIFAALGFVIGYVLTYRLWGVHAIYVGYFLHLIARVVYLSIEWSKVYDRAVSK